MNILMFLNHKASLDPVIYINLKKHARVFTISKNNADFRINKNDTVDVKKLEIFIEKNKITHFFYSENSSYIPLFLNQLPLQVMKVMLLIDTHINKKRRLPYLSLFDHILLVNQHQVKELSAYNPNISWLTYGADTNAFYKIPDSLKKHEVTFDGNIIPWIHYHRFFLLLYLKFNGISVYYPKATYFEHNKIYNESKILLNRSPLGGWNLRIFESLASGSLLITDRPKNGLENIFIDKKHLVYYDSLADLKNKIEYYLTNTKEREKIAKAGNELVNKEYTWEVQIKKMIQIVTSAKIKNFKKAPYYLSLSNLQCFSFRDKALALHCLAESKSKNEISFMRYYYYKCIYLSYLSLTQWLISMLNFIRVHFLLKPFEEK